MKKGFTLIELLAVIVILAIIAIIATPIVLSIIKNSKVSSSTRSAENYLGAIETKILQSVVDGNKIYDGVYTINGEENMYWFYRNMYYPNYYRFIKEKANKRNNLYRRWKSSSLFI